MKKYEAPTMTELGSLASTTNQTFNKIGGASDEYSLLVPVIGSLVPVGD